MQLDAAINDELAKLSPAERDEAMALVEKFYRNLARSRRHEADLLASIANGLTDPRGLGHANVERIKIKDFVRSIVHDELKNKENAGVRDHHSLWARRPRRAVRFLTRRLGYSDCDPALNCSTDPLAVEIAMHNVRFRR